MSRDVSTSVAAAVAGANPHPELLIAAYFDSGTVRAWTGYGPLSWNGETWDGLGTFLSLSAVEESTEIKAVGTQVSLSGIPQELLALAMSENYQSRKLEIYLAVFDENNAIIPDPVLMFSGRMDIMEIAEGGDTATITVSVENRLIDLERARARRYTNEDQKIDYPNDRGLEYVAAIQEKKIEWGR